MGKKCENCIKCVRVGVFGSAICNENGNCKNYNKFEPKPQTNRQWLESLSDEELAKQLNETFRKHNSSCGKGWIDSCIYEFSCNGKNCKMELDIVDWLQAEHKE